MGLEQQDFEYVQRLVRENSAIVLDASKGYLVESRLEPLVRGLAGVESLSDLIRRLRDTPVGLLHRQVVDAMTTNETSFFRDVKPFEALRKHILPGILERRASQKQLSIWCAACSSGQEPYSLAMLLREHFPVLRTWNLRIRGTDLSPTMVRRAREGRYSQLEINRGLPAPMLVKYFKRDGTSWIVGDELRSGMQFEEMNLIRPWPAMQAMDLVFLRNVLIYFDVQVKKQIFAGVRKVLKQDGFLFLGAAETTMNLDDAFVRVEYDKAGCFQYKG